MKNTIKILTALALIFSSLPINLLAEAQGQPKVQVKKISLMPNAGDAVNVKRIVVNRPSGWLPNPQEVRKVRELLPRPVKEIRLDEVRIDTREKQSQVEKEKAGVLIAGLEKIFGNKSKKGAAPVALLPVGCGYCGDPQLTVVNTTFEPVTAYVYESDAQLAASQTLLPGESVVFVLTYAGDWSVEVYGENTQSWIFDSGLTHFPCDDRETWAIADPFSALDVANYTYSDLLLCANDAYCSQPVGLVPSGLTYEFYFYPGTRRITIMDATWPNPLYFDSVLSLFANEITLLEVGY